MSGAGWKRKADVRTDDFLIENKTKMSPTAKSYSLKAEELRKLQLQALQEGRIPLFQVDLGGRKYVVLVENDFLDLIGDEG